MGLPARSVTKRHILAMGFILVSIFTLTYYFFLVSHVLPDTERQLLNELLAVKHQVEAQHKNLHQFAGLISPKHLNEDKLSPFKKISLVATGNASQTQIHLSNSSETINPNQLVKVAREFFGRAYGSGVLSINQRYYSVSLTPYTEISGSQNSSWMLLLIPLPTDALNYSENLTLEFSTTNTESNQNISIHPSEFTTIHSQFLIPLIHETPLFLKVSSQSFSAIRSQLRDGFFIICSTLFVSFMGASWLLSARISAHYDKPLRELTTQAHAYLESAKSNVFSAPPQDAPTSTLAKTLINIAQQVDSMKLKLESERNRFMDASYNDALTKLRNRRHLNETLDSPSHWSYQQKWVFILLDIDHFKHINDKFGHDMGDIVLSQISSLVKSICRDQDICYRWGGEEFAIICEDMDVRRAKMLCERVRTQCAAKTFGNRLYPLNLTISLGWCAFENKGNEQLERHWRDLFKVADLALYEAKEQGRNTWVGYFDGDAVLAEPASNAVQLKQSVEQGIRQRCQHGSTL